MCVILIGLLGTNTMNRETVIQNKIRVALSERGVIT